MCDCVKIDGSVIICDVLNAIYIELETMGPSEAPLMLHTQDLVHSPCMSSSGMDL